MATADLLTYNVVHDLSLGNNLGVTPVVFPLLNAVPSRLYAGDSFELIVTLYESYTDAANYVECDFLNTPACKLYAKVVNTTATPTLVNTGSVGTGVGGVKKNRCTFRVVAPGLPAALAGANKILLYVQVTDTTSGQELEVTAQQEITLRDHNGTGANNPTAPQMPFAPAVAGDWVATAPANVAEALDDLSARPLPWAHVHKTTTASLTAVGGRVLIFADTSGGAYALTLPAANAKAGCEYVIISSGHALMTITPAGTDTINSQAASIYTLGCVTLHTDGTSNWYAE